MEKRDTAEGPPSTPGSPRTVISPRSLETQAKRGTDTPPKKDFFTHRTQHSNDVDTIITLDNNKDEDSSDEASTQAQPEDTTSAPAPPPPTNPSPASPPPVPQRISPDSPMLAHTMSSSNLNGKGGPPKAVLTSKPSVVMVRFFFFASVESVVGFRWLIHHQTTQEKVVEKDPILLTEEKFNTEIFNFPEVSLNFAVHNQHRDKIAYEFLTTERTYVRSLSICLHVSYNFTRGVVLTSISCGRQR